MKKNITPQASKESKQINVFIQFSRNEILVGKLVLDNRLIHYKTCASI